VDALSGHGDYEEMCRYLSCQNKAKVQNIFLVHGEKHVQMDYKDYLIDNGFSMVSIPSFRESVDF